MNAAERLRDALENSSILNDDSTFRDEEHLIALRDAARTIALPILEGGLFPALARLSDAITLFEEACEAGGDIADESDEVYEAAREVRGQCNLLAAISTPTPMEES